MEVGQVHSKANKRLVIALVCTSVIKVVHFLSHGRKHYLLAINYGTKNGIVR